MWTSSWHRPRATNQKITFFNLSQRDIHGQVYRKYHIKSKFLILLKK